MSSKSKSTAQSALPSTAEERPHACYEGVVFMGHLVEGDDGNEVEGVQTGPGSDGVPALVVC
jgi:hypothetical protein